MKKINLSRQGKKHAGKYFALVSDIDYMWLSQYNWAVRVDRTGKNKIAYAFRTVQYKNIRTNLRMHREVWKRAHGIIPSGYEIDHKEHGDFGGLDNRRSNLRLCTHKNNRANSRVSSNNTSGHKGVRWHSRNLRWESYMSVDGKFKCLGFFDDLKEAVTARCVAVQAYYDISLTNP